MIGVKLFAIETDVQKKRRVNAITKRCIVGFPSSVNYGQRTRLGTVREAAMGGRACQFNHRWVAAAT
jgi:hypothetical protein